MCKNKFDAQLIETIRNKMLCFGYCMNQVSLCSLCEPYINNCFLSRIMRKDMHLHVETNKLTCKDGRGGLEKARLSLVASWDTAVTAWSVEKG